MPLSPHEQKILAAIEEQLGGQDPRLAATLSRPWQLALPGRPVALRWGLLLVGALVGLVGVHALGLVPGAAGTAVLTVVLLVPWLVLASRAVGPYASVPPRRAGVTGSPQSTESSERRTAP